jgi:hypothetical protein
VARLDKVLVAVVILLGAVLGHVNAANIERPLVEDARYDDTALSGVDAVERGEPSHEAPENAVVLAEMDDDDNDDGQSGDAAADSFSPVIAASFASTRVALTGPVGIRASSGHPRGPDEPPRA